MASLARFLFDEGTNVSVMYHGGMDLSRSTWVKELQLRPTKKGRYESGVGLNMTNSLETARAYAKGGGVVNRIFLRMTEFGYADEVMIDVSAILNFLNSFTTLPRNKKTKITSDIVAAAKRRRRDGNDKEKIPASTLVNLMVNHEAGSGKAGIEITQFLLSQGVHGILTPQHSGEVWLVLFDMSRILRVEKVDPAKPLSPEEWLLPSPH
jgi:hypothetical protein